MAASGKPSQPRRAGRAKAKEKVVRSYFDAIAARDVNTLASHWHPEGIADLVPIGILCGPSAVRSFFAELFVALPDSDFVVEKMVIDAEGAAVQWRLSGTFEGGPFQGIEPTGRRIELRGCDLIEVDDDGKLTRNSAYYDGAAFARQIGMLPAQDSGADRAIRASLNAVTRLRTVVAQRTQGGTT
jgi:steroid delta-isomerase-like uncharacterized protein